MFFVILLLPVDSESVNTRIIAGTAIMEDNDFGPQQFHTEPYCAKTVNYYIQLDNGTRSFLGSNIEYCSI